MSRVAPRTTGTRSTTRAPMVRPFIALDPHLHTLMFCAKNEGTVAYGVSCHITCASALAPPGEGRAPAAGTDHAPQGDHQALAVDESVLSSAQGSSASQGVGQARAAGTSHAHPRETLSSPVLPQLYVLPTCVWAVALSSPFELSVVVFARLSLDFDGCFFVLFASARLFGYECLECNSSAMA